MSSHARNPYTSDDERLLVKYIAKYNPQEAGRSGNALYKTLVENEQNKWSWAKRHPWQSWRDRYYKNKNYFDKKIRQYQKKHSIDTDVPRKALSSARQKRTRPESDESDEEEDEKDERAEDDRKRKRQRVEDVQRRAKIERERRENLKEETEEEEDNVEMGRDASGGKAVGHKPVSTAEQAQRVADERIDPKPKDGNRAGEAHDADDEISANEGEEEEGEGPVASDSYEGGLFGSSEDEVEEDEVIEPTDAHTNSETEEDMDAQEVDQQLTSPAKSGSTTSSSRDKLKGIHGEAQSGEYESIYPAITSVPSPHLRAHHPAEPQVPGTHAAPPSYPPPAPVSTSVQKSRKPPQTSATKPALQPSALINGKPIPDPPRRNPAVYAHAYPLLQRAALAADEDFFGSRPSTPTPAPQNGIIAGSNARKRPPKLMEGPFGNSFAGTRRSGGGDSGTESEEVEGQKEAWPPARRRTVSGTDPGPRLKDGRDAEQEKDLGGGKVVDKRKAPDHKAINKGKGKEMRKAIPVMGTTTRKSPKLGPDPVPPARRPRPTQVNAQPSSSRTLLSDLPPPPPSAVTAPALPPQSASHPRRVTLPGKSSDASARRLFSQSSPPPDRDARTRHGEVPVAHHDDQGKISLERRAKGTTRLNSLSGDGEEGAAPPKVKVTHVQSHKPEQLVNGRPAGSNDQIMPPLPIPSRVSQNGSLKRQPSSLRKELSFTMPTESWTPGNPFIDQRKAKAHDNFTRRHSIGTFPSSEVANASRRVDLREELARSTAAVRMRQSLPLRSRTASLHSTPDSGRFGGRSVSAGGDSPLLALPKTDEDLATVQLLGVSRALSMIAKNTSFSEETVMKVWQALGSIARTEDYFNRLKSVVGEASEKIYEAMEMEEEQREKGERSKFRHPSSEPPVPGSSPERIDLEHPPSSSPRRSTNSERQDLYIRPLRQDDGNAAMSDYSPPHSSRAGQYARLMKQGRRDEALTRERRRASGGGTGVFLPREIPTPMETSQTPEVQEEGSEEVPRTRSPTPEAGVTPGVGAFGLEPPEGSQWGDEEEAAFMSATAENADVLRQIESRVAPEFMRKWTAAHLMHIRQKAHADEPLTIS